MTAISVVQYFALSLNPQTHTSDQDKISPYSMIQYNINQINDENKKNIDLGIIS